MKAEVGGGGAGRGKSLGLTRGDDCVSLKQEHFPHASLFRDTGTCGRVSSVSQQSTMASHTLLYL